MHGSIRGTVYSLCPSEELDSKLLSGRPTSVGSIEDAEMRSSCLRVGSVLAGKYRLDALLGEGSMGSVWQATNLLLDAPVAIKLKHSELAGRAFRERLQLEARAAAGLGHPGIVRVYDMGETADGEPFIVMELLQGSTLAQMLSRGPLSAVRAVQLVLPVVDALAAMHARGVVHRDLKPDNLFIALEHELIQPKILDFGIAKRNDARCAGLDLGERGALVGSPVYMSPEQVRTREDVDFRTDIWSICVVLYEAIAGVTPFDAPDPGALLTAIVEAEPSRLAAGTEHDDLLWEIIRIGLAKDRSARHASMSELGRALASWLSSQGVAHDVCGTALEAKWFAGAPVPSFTEPAAPDGSSGGACSGGPGERQRDGTLRASRHQPPTRPGRRAKRRWGVTTAKVLTLGAAALFGFFFELPKHPATTLVAVSKAACFVGAVRGFLYDGASGASVTRQRRTPIPIE